MAYELQEGKGYIFENKSWKPDTKFPKARGDCLYNGQPVTVAIWPKKEGKQGAYFVIAPKRERQEPAPPAPAYSEADLPF